jgi:predicted nucleotidyltransferase
MKTLDAQTELAARAFLSRISEQFPVDSAIVYGSRARGTHRPDSDADLAVLLKGEHQRFMTTKLAMADVAFDVMLDTGVLVSPLPIWLDEWASPDDYSNPLLLRNIQREGIPL